MTDPNLALWRAVLLAGLRAPDADDWMGTADFYAVCDLAQVDPDAVVRAVATRRPGCSPKTHRPRRRRAA